MCGKEGREAEIEVTPAMIEAGLPHLYRYSKDVDEVECLKRIFRAMVLAATDSPASPSFGKTRSISQEPGDE
jgi:hypothetical protein